MPATPHSSGLGIDFGTSHTVAVIRRPDGRVEPLLFDSSPLLPSAVFAPPDGRPQAGRDALDWARVEPSRFEPNPKRRVDDGTVLLGERELAVAELFAAVLDRVREEYVKVTGYTPVNVTLTYPAAWGPARRAVLLDAARRAGLGEPALVPEPVAAATYFVHQLHHEVPVGSAVVVHDFGGGTFDASVVRRTASGFEVLAVGGLDDLGGVDVDEAIIGHLRSRIGAPEVWERLLRPESPVDRRHRRTFLEDIRRAKERLSRHSTADLFLPLLDQDVHLTRGELESLTGPMLARAVAVVLRVIGESGVTRADVAGVFLVGGSSRMPLVATMLHRELGIAPTAIDQIDQIVAHGALLATPAPVAFTPPPPVSAPPYTPPIPVSAPPVSAPPVSAPPVSGPPVSPAHPPQPPVYPSGGNGPVFGSEPGKATYPTHLEPATMAAIELSWKDALPPAPVKGKRNWQAVVSTLLSLAVVAAIMVYAFSKTGGGGLPDFLGGGDSGSGGPSMGKPTSTYDRASQTQERVEIAVIDGKPFVVGSDDFNSIRVWDASTGDEKATLKEESIGVKELAVINRENDDPLIAYNMTAVGIKVWNPVTGDVDVLTDYGFGSGKLMAGGVLDGKPALLNLSGSGKNSVTVTIINPANGKRLGEWTNKDIYADDASVGVIDGEPVIALAGNDKTDNYRVILARLSDGKVLRVIEPKIGQEKDSDPRSGRVAVTGGNPPAVLTANGVKEIERWNAATGEPIGDAFTGIPTTVDMIRAVQWGERWLVMSVDDFDDLALVWDPLTGEVVKRFSLDDLDGDIGLQAAGIGVVGAKLVLSIAVLTESKVHTWVISP
ncbi:hypothetical protein Afil01_63540 [Actinorhabdospora filicis]|uniref:Hsp70 protein n=1 Tax=Actinorhabdospora filicis TaxID=1785913 RepID=A0A9W6W6H3_9ACTN|nr:Hsp70 family protein [Actinorhabdospora filicis]GLZ81547.1 hypothetical protein Afil01_63540 [Actinorhabdospora filicis]